ncbi:MAG: CRISPR-associated endoribonuclease Cas6 [Thermoplasmatales archaeon B_DKE]|nr:MAG: CRISPR-associated endoribonuclease Cas6 [Thermoplasmatales archaeon B_DKE]
MRVRFLLGFRERMTLPIQYNHLLQAFIYTNVRDKELQVRYHDQGFVVNGKHIKMFTFSRLFGKYEMNQSAGSITFFPPVSMTVSSVGSDFMSEFTEEILKSDQLYLNGTKVEIESFDPLSFKGNKDRVQIEMLSPLTVYRTLSVDGKNSTKYFSPWDEEFEELIRSNLIKKNSIIDKASSSATLDFSIKPMMERNDKFQKIMNFKGTIIKGWLGSYLLSGSEELIRLAYYSGLGSKNSEGFGCFRIFGTGE